MDRYTNKNQQEDKRSEKGRVEWIEERHKLELKLNSSELRIDHANKQVFFSFFDLALASSVAVSALSRWLLSEHAACFSCIIFFYSLV